MARDNITVTTLVRNTGTTVTHASVDTAISTCMEFAASAVDVDEKILLHVKSTGATKAIVTLKAGGFQGAIADVSVDVAKGAEKMFIFDTAQFRQTTGKVNINFASTTGGTLAGSVAAYKLPSP